MNAVCAIGHRASLRNAACSAMVGMPRLTFALGMAGVGRIVLAGPTPVPLLVGVVVTAISPSFLLYSLLFLFFLSFHLK